MWAVRNLFPLISPSGVPLALYVQKAEEPQTLIVPVLNGMRHMDLLMERFGKHAVLGGLCVVATEMDPQGRIVQLADFRSLRYGNLTG